MVKKVIQDINIHRVRRKNIEVPSFDNTVIEKPATNCKAKEVRKHSIPRTPIMKKNGLFSSWIFKVLLAIVAITALYFVCNLFQKATINIKTRTADINLGSEVFTASKNNPKNPHFEIMILNDSISKTVNFGERKSVSTKAHGNVILKNEYSVKPQKISVNTHLIDDYGHIYTTDTAVTIPGYTKDSSGVVPGSVVVGITAVGAGDMYNTESKAFLIQGFQKTDKYTKIYASGNGPVTGGAQGDMYTLDPVELGKIQAEANSILKDQILRKLSAQIPEGYVLYPNATEYTASFDSNTQSKTKDGAVEVKGSISAIIIKQSELEAAIIKNALPNTSDSEYSEIHVSDLSAFSFNFSDTSKHITKDLTDVSFKLTGKTTLLWKPDMENIKSLLLGLPVASLSDTLKNDPGILDASVSFRFPWQKYLPTELKKIEILSK